MSSNCLPILLRQQTPHSGPTMLGLHSVARDPPPTFERLRSSRSDSYEFLSFPSQSGPWRNGRVGHQPPFDPVSRGADRSFREIEHFTWVGKASKYSAVEPTVNHRNGSTSKERSGGNVGASSGFCGADIFGSNTRNTSLFRYQNGYVVLSTSPCS